MSEVVLRNVFLSLIHSVSCLHSMLDPHHTWRHYFINDKQEENEEWNDDNDIISIPVELISFFTAVFTLRDIPLHFDLCSELYSDLQIELLHMMGALLSSVEVNQFIVLCIHTHIVCTPLM